MEKISALENRLLEALLKAHRELLEAMKSGGSVDRLCSYWSKKERYLEALVTYGSFGLTSEELFKKRAIWLVRPNEPDVTKRVKTVSMFLRRLQLGGLASRVREGYAYRYFISKNGIKRLEYYAHKH